MHISKKIRKVEVPYSPTEYEPFDPPTVGYPVDREELIELYYDKKLSTGEIAKKLGLGKTTIRRYMEFYKIPRRGYSEASLIQHSRRRKKEMECEG